MYVAYNWQVVGYARLAVTGTARQASEMSVSLSWISLLAKAHYLTCCYSYNDVQIDIEHKEIWFGPSFFQSFSKYSALITARMRNNHVLCEDGVA